MSQKKTQKEDIIWPYEFELTVMNRILSLMDAPVEAAIASASPVMNTARTLTIPAPGTGRRVVLANTMFSYSVGGVPTTAPYLSYTRDAVSQVLRLPQAALITSIDALKGLTTDENTSVTLELPAVLGNVIEAALMYRVVEAT